MQSESESLGASQRPQTLLKLPGRVYSYQIRSEIEYQIGVTQLLRKYSTVASHWTSTRRWALRPPLKYTMLLLQTWFIHELRVLNKYSSHLIFGKRCAAPSQAPNIDLGRSQGIGYSSILKHGFAWLAWFAWWHKAKNFPISTRHDGICQLSTEQELIKICLKVTKGQEVC